MTRTELRSLNISFLISSLQCEIFTLVYFYMKHRCIYWLIIDVINDKKNVNKHYSTLTTNYIYNWSYLKILKVSLSNQSIDLAYTYRNRTPGNKSKPPSFCLCNCTLNTELGRCRHKAADLCIGLQCMDARLC